MFELKKYRGVMFDGTEDWCEIWRKTDYISKMTLGISQICIGWNKWIAHLTKLFTHVYRIVVFKVQVNFQESCQVR